VNNKFFKKIISLFGYKLINKNYFKNNRIISEKSYLQIELILKNLFEKNKIKSLIQIGANDGLLFDVLNQYIKKFQPSSLLVEPLLENFEKLKKNYNNLENIKFENSAISVNNEISSLYKVKLSKIHHYDEHILGITSFNKNHLLEHGVKNSHISKEKVQCISIDKLLIKHSIKTLDLLFIDAEGYDSKIIYDFFKNSLLRPLIIFEYIHCDYIFFRKLINRLNEINYVYFSINENLIGCPIENKQLIDFS
jgi:FkbM family methyltransferase